MITKFIENTERYAKFPDIIYLDNISEAFDIYSEYLAHLYNIPVETSKFMLKKWHDKEYFYMELYDFAYCLALKNTKPTDFKKPIREADIDFHYGMLLRYHFLFDKGIASDNEKYSIRKLLKASVEKSLNALAYSFLKTQTYLDTIKHIHQALAYYASILFKDDDTGDKLADILMDNAKIELKLEENINTQENTVKYSYGYVVNFQDAKELIEKFGDLLKEDIIKKIYYQYDKNLLIQGNENFEVIVKKDKEVFFDPSSIKDWIIANGYAI